MQSLDPRIRRAGLPANDEPLPDKPVLDQFETYEVFQQPKEGKPYEHAGIVHAPNVEMAFLFGKEQFTRRGPSCTGLMLARTADVYLTDYTEGEGNAFDLFPETLGELATSPREQYEIFLLKRRGKQHLHAGSVQAGSYTEALAEARRMYYVSPCLNLWVMRTADLLFSDADDQDFWNTLSEKKYRDAIAYRSADKIKQYIEANPA